MCDGGQTERPKGTLAEREAWIDAKVAAKLGVPVSELPTALPEHIRASVIEDHHLDLNATREEIAAAVKNRVAERAAARAARTTTKK
jgi:hypothetical protein